MLIPRQVRETLIRQQEAQDESGAVLILALIFLVAVSLIVTGLLTFAGTSLNATGSFATERNVEFTSTSAVNLAIQNTRYSFDVGSPHQFLNNATPELCASYPLQTASVNVYCTLVWQPYSSNTRVLYVLCLPFLGRCQCRHGLCRESAAAGHRCLRRLSTRGRFASTDPERLYADCAAGEPSERSGKWLLWREHDPDQLAMESRGARDHLPLLLDWAHDRGNHGHDQRDGIHQW